MLVNFFSLRYTFSFVLVLFFCAEGILSVSLVSPMHKPTRAIHSSASALRGVY